MAHKYWPSKQVFKAQKIETRWEKKNFILFKIQSKKAFILPKMAFKKNFYFQKSLLGGLQVLKISGT